MVDDRTLRWKVGVNAFLRLLERKELTCGAAWRSTALVLIMLITSCSGSHMPASDSGVTEFVEASPGDLNWMPMPDGGDILVAILVGDPNVPGPLVARYDIPPNTEIVPHTHREPRSYTVISGIWQLGFGTEFDARELRAYPPGSYYRLPPDVPHFQKAGPEGAVIQIESIGPDTFVPIE